MLKLTSIALVTALFMAGNAAAYIDYTYVKTPVGPEMDWVNGIAIDANGVIYVVQGNVNAVTKIAVDGTLSTFGSLSPGDASTGGALNRPNSVAVDPSGNIFVTQYRPFGYQPYDQMGRRSGPYQNDPRSAHALAMFPSDGIIRRLWSAGLDHPFGVAVGPSTDPISSRDRNAIFIAGPGGVYRTRPDQTGLGTGECSESNWGYCRPQPFGPRFDGARGVAVDWTGNVWVSDTTGRDNVKRLYADGTKAKTYYGFKHPTDIATDLGTRAYVADTDHDTVKIVDRGSTSDDVESELPSGLLDRPRAIAVEPNCRERCSIYVYDTGRRRIWKFTPTR